jgi:hypothetical protein
MIYVKSIAAGLVALIVISALIIGGAPLVIGTMHPATGGAGIGWSFVDIPVLPLMTGVLLISAAISYSVFRRLSRG